MSSIRQLDRADLHQIVSLTRAAFPAHARVTVEAQTRFLHSVLFDYPWYDPDIASLVATDDDGRIVGMIAAHVRRMRFGERTLRAACCSHLVVDPAHRAGATAARLLQTFLAQPQDLSYSDTATAAVARMWRMYGGEHDSFRSFEWMQLFRPVAWARELLRHRFAREGVDRQTAPVGAIPFHIAGRRITGRESLTDSQDTRTGPLSDEWLADHVADLTRSWSLRLDYDADYLAWVFAALEQRASAPVVRRVVFLRDRPIGWFAYVLNRSATSRVVQLVAHERHADAVVGELFRDARDRGSIALGGRVERSLDEALRKRLVVVGFGDRFVWHSRDAEVNAAIASRQSLLSRLDGEWW